MSQASRLFYKVPDDLACGVSIIVITPRGRLLVSQRRSHPGSGMDQFPGGHVEPGESPLAGARRELREETGLDLAPERFTSLGSEYAISYDGGLYRGFRYGVVLEPGEHWSNPEPAKHTDWQEQELANVLLGADLVANNKAFACLFAMTRLAVHSRVTLVC